MKIFGTILKVLTQPKIRGIVLSDISKCPFMIFVPIHYREDGTCKCNDQEHRQFMIENWEYTIEDFIEAGVI